MNTKYIFGGIAMAAIAMMLTAAIVPVLPVDAQQTNNQNNNQQSQQNRVNDARGNSIAAGGVQSNQNTGGFNIGNQ